MFTFHKDDVSVFFFLSFFSMMHVLVSYLKFMIILNILQFIHPLSFKKWKIIIDWKVYEYEMRPTCTSPFKLKLSFRVWLLSGGGEREVFYATQWIKATTSFYRKINKPQHTQSKLIKSTTLFTHDSFRSGVLNPKSLLLLSS